jgi:hypothetical protein
LKQPAAISTHRKDPPVATGARGVGTTLDLTVNNFVSLQRRTRKIETTNEEINAGSKRMTSKGWARDIGFHPVDQTHPAKLAHQVDLSRGSDDGLVPHQKLLRGGGFHKRAEDDQSITSLGAVIVPEGFDLEKVQRQNRV